MDSQRYRGLEDISGRMGISSSAPRIDYVPAGLRVAQRTQDFYFACLSCEWSALSEQKAIRHATRHKHKTVRRTWNQDAQIFRRTPTYEENENG